MVKYKYLLVDFVRKYWEDNAQLFENISRGS